MQNNHHPSQCTFPAMVQPIAHQISGIYPADQALRRGTLFPELDKPMRNSRGHGTCAATAHQALSFAAWEVRLHLNTHPCDERALALYRDLCSQMEKPSYACVFAGCNQNGWNWLDDPWPWEYAANDGRD